MKYFGIDWDLDLNVYRSSYDPSYEYGEVMWTSKQFAPLDGGQFYVIHDDQDGTFDLAEMGGAGPNVWDRDIEDRLISPMAAFAAAAREIKRQERVIEIWEREHEVERALPAEEPEAWQMRWVWDDRPGDGLLVDSVCP